MMRTFSGGGLLGETKTTGTEDEAVDVVVRVARLVHCSRVGPRVWARVTCVAAGEKREAVLGPADVRENAFAERGAGPRGNQPDFNVNEFYRPSTHLRGELDEKKAPGQKSTRCKKKHLGARELAPGCLGG